MEFTSQICTTEEQSERLLSLGLKKETADMTYLNDKICTASYNEMECPYDNLVKPAWSLHRLIEMAELPQYWVCISGNWYEEVIAHLQSMIHINEFNKEYLEE